LELQLVSRINAKGVDHRNLELLAEVLKNEEHEKIRMFLNSALKAFVNDPEFQMEFGEFLEKQEEEEFFDIIESIIVEGLEYLFELFACVFDKFGSKTEFLTQRRDDGENFLMTACKSGNVKIFDKIWSLMEKEFSREEMRELCLATDNENANLLHYSVHNDENGYITVSLIEKLKKNLSVDAQIKMLTEKEGKLDANCLLLLAQNGYEKVLTLIWNFAKVVFTKVQLKDYLSETDSDRQNVLQCVLLLSTIWHLLNVCLITSKIS
jgi:hypothetical protein